MIRTITFNIKELEVMKKYPKDIYYLGNTKLLNNNKISIVGARRPNQYARTLTYELSKRLSQQGITIISGGAMGIDTIAHTAATYKNTIMVAGTGLDSRYPSINRSMIQEIEEKGLVLSLFKEKTPSFAYNFPIRNELVVALGDVLIVSFAQLNSGTLRSVAYALKMKKKIYVLPHRLNESNGSNELLKNSLASAIFDIDEFVEQYSPKKQVLMKDEFLLYCKTNPSYDEAILKYGSKVYEYEIEAKIKIENGKIIIN